MNKFAEIAKDKTSISPVMEGRTKISTKDVKERYPEGVTLIEFDFLTSNDPRHNDKPFPVFAIAEDETVCFFGGEILGQIAKSWADAFDGDIAGASAELKNSGGVKVKLKSATSKMGNDYTAVEVIG